MADYGKIINKSIETTKKFKWLWIYGLILGAAGGSSFNIPSGGGNSSYSDKSGDQFENLFKDLPSPTSNPNEVLGTFTNQIIDWFKSVNPQTWLLLFLGLVLVMIIGIAISWVLSAWANGGLIGGLKLAHQNKEVNLKNTSPLGFANIKPLIKLSIIHFVIALLAIFAIVIVGFIVGFAGVFLTESLGIVFKIVSALFLIAAIFGFIYLLINYSFTLVYAQRYVVLEKLAAWEAWKAGWKLVTKNFFPSIVMGIVGGLTSALAGCATVFVLLVILGIPAVIFAMPMFTKQEFKPANIIALVLIAIIFFVANFIIRSILVVFNASNWNLFWEEIKNPTKIKEAKNEK